MTLKFVFDRLVSAMGLLFLSPLLVIIALYLRLVLPKGKILFRQQRVGRYGRLFTIYKFRTMEQDANGTMRVINAAAFLRRTKMDELPELWNVLCGDMSFVGPRPDVPGYADNLTNSDRDILLLRPGITGPATMKYRDEETLLAAQNNPQEYNDTVIWPDKVRINLYYLHHYSFWKDLQMIVYTLLGRKMEYGGEMI
jgi:lipopolysaccharide/colanic/teichoic acid biosynthesis glycosyltransferase